MATRPGLIRMCTGVSLVASMLLFVILSIYTYDWHKVLGFCTGINNNMTNIGISDSCKAFRRLVVGAELGIAAASIQLGSSVLGFLGKGKMWAMAQLLVLTLLTIVIIAHTAPPQEEAFDNATDADELPEPGAPGLCFPGFNPGKVLMFQWAAICDAILTLMTTLLVCKSISS